MNVAVIGVGLTRFGEFWDRSYRDMITEAGIKASLAGQVSDPLYAEAQDYLESMGLFW